MTAQTACGLCSSRN